MSRADASVWHHRGVAEEARTTRDAKLPLVAVVPDAPQLRPFFGYYGGKWRDAVKHYPAPQFDIVMEPFAGSAGYALRYAERNVVLCDG